MSFFLLNGIIIFEFFGLSFCSIGFFHLYSYARGIAFAYLGLNSFWVLRDMFLNSGSMLFYTTISLSPNRVLFNMYEISHSLTLAFSVWASVTSLGKLFGF